MEVTTGSAVTLSAEAIEQLSSIESSLNAILEYHMFINDFLRLLMAIIIILITYGLAKICFRFFNIFFK